MANVPNPSRTRNVNPSRPRPQPQEPGRHALKNVVVPLELPPAGHALLKAIAIQDGCSSVEQYIRELIIEECQAFAQALADPEDPELAELFALNRKEVARL